MMNSKWGCARAHTNIKHKGLSSLFVRDNTRHGSVVEYGSSRGLDVQRSTRVSQPIHTEEGRGERKRLETRTVQKCVEMQLLELRAKLHRGELFAVREGVLAKLHKVLREVNTNKLLASHEGMLPDTHEALGKRDVHKGRAP